MDIPKAFNAKDYEDEIYQRWEASGFFNPDVCIKKGITSERADTFTIILPPPNVTGELHLGHASMLAYEDLIIRYQRLLGKQTLWLPGTDHAAIATQTKVEKLLADEGKSREDLGRDKFIEKVKDYVNRSKDTIYRQIRKIGSSLDWSREKYTLDEEITEIVYSVFTKMYEDGLIYRGSRIVNWCPRCQSTLADDEVEYQQKQTPFYYFKYGPVVIGTARPETKFADKVIIVHPDDNRYKKLIGKKFTVPWIEGEVEAQVIADKIAEPELGTGAMTITPAHSFVDFELAQKYGLEVKKIIDEQGNLTEVAGSFFGMNANQARDKIVAKMKAKGLVDHIDENYIHNLSVCYRCGMTIEPLLSRQWFIEVNKKIPQRGKSLKQLAIEAVRTGLAGKKNNKIEIIPERFNKIYFHWLENLRDWCISRQIWWGHRIPVWYKQEAQNPKSKIQKESIYVGVNPPAGDNWVQDEDTLDTWFSSALWTFSTLGWPKGEDFKHFHPTQVLETGYDILFFWVARMILMTTYATGQIPFQKVYLHGLVRDRQGRKMSKSLDNGIDPLDMIAKFGADALRLSMVIGVTPGNDLNLYEEKIAGYRNFVNKLWNISRFILFNIDQPKITDKIPEASTLADRWILSEFNELIKEVTAQIECYNFSQAGEKLYDFTWNKLADWYLEIVKIEGDKQDILNYILQKLLILWHPFTPFVTETVWSLAFNKDKKDIVMLMVQKWPQSKTGDKKVLADFSKVKELIVTIRALRADNKIPPAKILLAKVKTKKLHSLFVKEQLIIERLARIKLELVDDKPVGDFIYQAEDDYDIYLLTNGDNQPRSGQDKEGLIDYISRLEKKLSNNEFVSKAPSVVVDKEREKLKQAKDKLAKLR